MTKTGPLGRAEKFFIEQHFTEKSIEQIAKDLGRNKGIIEKHINHYKKMLTKAGGQMAKHDRGAVAMTSTASSLGDEKSGIIKVNTKLSGCITTVTGNDQ